MNIRAIFRMLVPLHLMRCSFGGDSESNSAQTTKNTDARVVGGDSSSNASVNDNQGTVSIMTTDHGAVSGSLQLALKGIEGAQQTTQQAIASTGGLLENALQQSGQQAQQFTETIKDIKTSDVRVLVVAGLAVVGIGAFAMFKAKG